MPRTRVLHAPLIALISVTIAVLTSGAQRRQMDPLTGSLKQTMHQSMPAAGRTGAQSEVFAGTRTRGSERTHASRV